MVKIPVRKVSKENPFQPHGEFAFNEEIEKIRKKKNRKLAWVIVAVVLVLLTVVWTFFAYNQ